MPLQYKDIVPWGRNYDEYVRMFDLNEEELRLRILGCGDGPASFNCVCYRSGRKVVSVDPLYQFSAEDINRRIEKTFWVVLQQTHENREQFKWDLIPTVEELGRIRMEAMREFLDSYAACKQGGRYVAGALPNLPFGVQEFDIALSSHFLFLYTNHLTGEFHEAAIREMLRVSKEIRIFPILDMTGQKSPFLLRTLEIFHDYELEIRQVKYEFQRGGNEVLVIRNK